MLRQPGEGPRDVELSGWGQRPRGAAAGEDRNQVGLGVAAVVTACIARGVPARGGGREHIVIAAGSTVIVGDYAETVAEMAEEHQHQEQNASKGQTAP